jgi:hypothetical protein
MLMVFFMNSGTVDGLAITRPRCGTEHHIVLTMVSWPSQVIAIRFMGPRYMFNG